MVDEKRPTGEAEGEPSDSRYFGPFGEPPRITSDTAASYDPIPTFGAPTWAPPSGEPVQAGPPGAAVSSATTAILPSGRTGRRPLSASIIAIAAATALVIGGAAGFGGAALAGRYRAFRCYDGQSFGTNRPWCHPRAGTTTADKCQHR